ncbi:MAG: hypothetical protein JTT16_01055 [Candidatus Brockarchaeota archaeon]|nr:hypothetical protein [Candidatus Brockarchaeota archaeon]
MQFLNELHTLRISKKAENEFVEAPCSIIDQSVVALGKENNASLIDACDARLTSAEFEGAAIAIAGMEKRKQ